MEFVSVLVEPISRMDSVLVNPPVLLDSLGMELGVKLFSVLQENIGMDNSVFAHHLNSAQPALTTMEFLVLLRILSVLLVLFGLVTLVSLQVVVLKALTLEITLVFLLSLIHI